MLTKHLLKLSLLLPLIAMSATAYAGETITSKSYWPSEAKRTVHGVTAPQNNPSSAFAYDRGASRLQPISNTNEGGSSPRYHGGPKSPW
ncbi:hypothetical protein V1282_003831 [Nitrobacteraceae bacterium AZCC 2146]